MFVKKLMDRDGLCGFEEMEIKELHKEVNECTRLVLNISRAQCAFGLYPLKLHMLDDIVKGVKRFGNLEMLVSSSFDRYNIHIESVYHRTCRRRYTSPRESVKSWMLG